MVKQRKSEEKLLSETVRVRLTSGEYKKVKAYCDREFLNVSGFIRRTIMKYVEGGYESSKPIHRKLI